MGFSEIEDRRRIVLVGDSFTFGTGVSYEETYGARLEAGLQGVAVLNLAMPGFGLDQVWQSVRHQALALRPHLIVVGIFPAMFERSRSAYRALEGFNKPTFRLQGDRLLARTADDRPSWPIHALEHHSGLWALGARALRGLAYRVPIGEWWRLNAALLDAIDEDCRARNVPVLFVYLPSNHWRSFATLSGYMARKDLHFVDVSRHRAEQREDLFFPADRHLNTKGHRFVADALLPQVRSILRD